MVDLGAIGLTTDSLRAAGNHSQAAQLYFEAGTKNESSELFVYAAWQFGEANHIDSALISIKRAINFGMNSPYILDKVGIEKESQTSALRPELDRLLNDIKVKNGSVENFEVITTPIDRFWNYFDQALNDTIHAKKHLSEYICEGSNALKDYYHIRYENTENMYQVMIKKNSEYYTYLKNYLTAEKLNKVSQQSELMMQKFSILYPKAVFPKTYLVPDLLNGTGTLTESALFIGADMFAKSKDMPLKNLSEWQLSTITEYSNMKYDLVHELMHFQQSYSDFENSALLLGKLIEEGVCDFLVSLLAENNQVSPGVQRNLDYLQIDSNYMFIMHELKRDIYGQDLSKWMHNGGAITDRPSNLGYTMGFLICKSFYENSTNKKQAIFELLNTNNFKKIIESSDFKELL
ncbi:hypothetical protein GCM10007028_30230 [Algibacter mikhailovii]|uniref:DUF2268 domain-containing protein n=1 Tax=Algibacter mikhailovii TaxID=425498 RepID=A0A918R7I7_9FLAO|nr:hypothetical protein GCM10007028_30230 [Algibacter mikhailovii]